MEGPAGALDGAELPMQFMPHDSLRQGLPALKDDATYVNPIEALQKKDLNQGPAARARMLRSVYGAALPALMQMEEQALRKQRRLPGMHSELVGLHAMTGALDEFGFEDYLADPRTAEAQPIGLHAAMEAKHHLVPKEAATTRPLP